MKEKIVYSIIGAGRAAELHLNALDRYAGIKVERKWIVAPRIEQAGYMGEKYGFDNITSDVNNIFNDPDVDIVDICTPPYAHSDYILRAIKSGKHVICEKPLIGYFGKEEDEQPIGDKVSKGKMYEKILEKIEELEKIAHDSGCKLMYAENFIYAPSIIKATEIIEKKKSKIMFMKGEESLKGSSSKVAGSWEKTGGGTFIRTGAHPLSAILWLKGKEAKARNENIYVKSVLADMTKMTPQLTDYDHRHIMARPNDVEDFGTAIIEFSDNTRAVIMATDTLLGGSKNYVELYCNDAVIYCKLTMSDLMSTYFLDEDNLDDVYLSEMLPAKNGWNNPFIEDEFIRGYTSEMKDFIESVYYDREPKSDFRLGFNTVKLIYAAYLSSEENRRIEIQDMRV